MRRILYSTCLYLLMFTGLGLVASTPAMAADSGRNAAAEKMLTGISKATWMKEGKGPRVVYIFFDPNCPYCHRVYLDTRSWVKRNAMEFRWIPVGVLTATSFGKAAAILDAKDPLKAFYQNEDHYSGGDGGGGIAEALVATSKTEKALRVNAALLQLSGFDAVPTLLFRANDGEAILIQGAPPAKKLNLILHYVK